MKQTMKRALSLALALALSVTILLPSAWAEGESNKNNDATITVKVRAQEAWNFIYATDRLPVEAGTAQKYGFSNADGVPDDTVTALDVLVAAHVDKYGSQFTKETASQYLSMSNGNFVEMFGNNNETKFSGFAINHDYAKDAAGNGYVTSSAPICDGDVVDFFYYEDENYCDFVTWFTDKNGESRDVMVAQKNAAITVGLKGYIFMDGYSEPPAQSLYDTDEALGIYIAVYDAEKKEWSIGEPVQNVTESTGQVQLTFEKSGNYVITANGYVGYTNAYTQEETDASVLAPYCYITVVEQLDAQEYVNAAYDNLTAKDILSGNSALDKINRNLTLPLSTYENTAITWSYTTEDSNVIGFYPESYDPDAEDSTSFYLNTVYIGDAKSTDTKATLTATITSTIEGAAATATKTFDLTVPAAASDSAHAATAVDFGQVMGGIASAWSDGNMDTSAISENDLPWAVIDMKAYGTGLDAAEKARYNSERDKDYSGTSNAALAKFILAETAVGNAPQSVPDDSASTSIYSAPYDLLARYACGYTGQSANQNLINTMLAYLNGDYKVVDTVAAVLPALAPYTSNDAVGSAVSGAVSWLSERQAENGTWNRNANSTAMVITALSALGIDAHTDSRFIKGAAGQKKSAVEGLLSFALTDNTGFGYGGNVGYNRMATEQSFRALVAYAKMKEKGGAYNLYLEAKNSAAKVRDPGITATVKPATPPVDIPENTETVSFTLVGDSTWISTTTVTLSSSVQTVGDVFETVLDSNGYTYAGLESGYIRSITTPSGKTLAEYDGGRNSGWMYTVNGDFPQVGLNDCYLTNGDSVRFFYTYDYTEDSPVEPAETPAVTTTTTTTANSDGTVTVTVKQGKETLDSVSGGVKAEVPNKSGTGNVVVLVDKDGNETILTKSLVNGESAFALLPGTCTVKIIDNAKDFSDVSDTAWYADAVDFVSGHELYNGTGGGAFSPNQPMSRAMLATVLHRLESTPESASDVLAGFHDGSAVSAWAQEGLSWAVANKVLEGVDGNRLAVDSTITREQLATMVYRYAKLCGMDLTVSDAAAVGGQGVSSWAETAMAWAVENGIIEGKDGGTLAPQAAASRAEVAAILQRLVAVMVK